MQTIINPESIRTLSASPQLNYNTNGATYSEPQKKPSLWSRFKAKIKDVWETIQPIVSGITSFFQAAADFMKAYATIKQGRKPYEQVAA